MPVGSGVWRSSPNVPAHAGLGRVPVVRSRAAPRRADDRALGAVVHEGLGLATRPRTSRTPRRGDRAPADGLIRKSGPLWKRVVPGRRVAARGERRFFAPIQLDGLRGLAQCVSSIVSPVGRAFGSARERARRGRQVRFKRRFDGPRRRRRWRGRSAGQAPPRLGSTGARHSEGERGSARGEARRVSDGRESESAGLRAERADGGARGDGALRPVIHGPHALESEARSVRGAAPGAEVDRRMGDEAGHQTHSHSRHCTPLRLQRKQIRPASPIGAAATQLAECCVPARGVAEGQGGGGTIARTPERRAAPGEVRVAGLDRRWSPARSAR